MPAISTLLATVLNAIAVLLVMLGLLVMTIAVIGLVRMREPIMKLHATSKAVVLGNVSLLLAAMTTGDGALMARALLIILFLLITAPLSAHVLARAMYYRASAERAEENAQAREAEPEPEPDQERGSEQEPGPERQQQRK